MAFAERKVFVSSENKLEEDFLELSGKERAEVLDFVEFLREKTAG